MEDDPLIEDESDEDVSVSVAAVLGFVMAAFVLSKIMPDLVTEVVLHGKSELKEIKAIISELSLCLMPVIASKCVDVLDAGEFFRIWPSRKALVAVAFMTASTLLSLALVKSDHCVSNPLTKEPSLFVIGVVHCVVPALCEEFVFRGWMFHALKGNGSITAAVISSAAFAMCHQFKDIFTTITIFLFSLCWTYANEQTESLLPGIAGHFSHNMILSVVIKILPKICDFSAAISMAIWCAGTVLIFTAVHYSNDEEKEPAALTA